MTRHQLLMLRANQRAGWVGYAIALHTMGEYENALNVLQTFRKTQEVIIGELREHWDFLRFVYLFVSVLSDCVNMTWSYWRQNNLTYFIVNDRKGREMTNDLLENDK